MLKVEDVKNFKVADEDLIKCVVDAIQKACDEYDEETNIIEECLVKINYNGINFDFISLSTSDWDDQGKYQYQNEYYQLVSFDNSEKSWVTKDNIIDKYDLCVDVPVSRSGSYFTEYYYTYEKPMIYFSEIKHVEEVIIPAHDEVTMRYLEEN